MLLLSNAVMTVTMLLSIDHIILADLGNVFLIYNQFSTRRQRKIPKMEQSCDTMYMYARWPVMFWILSMYLLRSKASEHELKYKYRMSPAERWRSFKLTFISDGDLSNMCLNIQLLACAASGKLALAFLLWCYTVLLEEYHILVCKVEKNLRTQF